MWEDEKDALPGDICLDFQNGTIAEWNGWGWDEEQPAVNFNLNEYNIITFVEDVQIYRPKQAPTKRFTRSKMIPISEVKPGTLIELQKAIQTVIDVREQGNLTAVYVSGLASPTYLHSYQPVRAYRDDPRFVSLSDDGEGDENEAEREADRARQENNMYRESARFEEQAFREGYY